MLFSLERPLCLGAWLRQKQHFLPLFSPPKKMFLTNNPINGIKPVMAKWIRKVEHNMTAFRVSVPKEIIDELGWKDCRYVTVEKTSLGEILIRRLPSNGNTNTDSSSD